MITDAMCLEHLWRTRYSEDGDHAECPKCEQERRFKRYNTTQGRQSWTCTGCGHHVHPTAGTVFHKSLVPLSVQARVPSLVRAGAGMSSVARTLGVSTKTARRLILHSALIETTLGELLDDFGDPVEVRPSVA